jgi:hypothetical protein
MRGCIDTGTKDEPLPERFPVELVVLPDFGQEDAWL